MTLFPGNGVLLTIGSFSVSLYAVTLILGIVCAYLYAARIMKKHGYANEVTDELLIICLIGGLIGGRIAWVLEHMSDYLRYLPYVFAIGDGGFDILGVVLGIAVVIRLYIHRRNLTYLRTLDVALPSIILFAAIARIGRVHTSTTIWYTIIIDLVGFALIDFLFRSSHEGRRRGDITTASMMWLGLSRLLALVFKWDPNASNSLILCILLEVLGLVIYTLVHNRAPSKPMILFDLDGTLMDSHRMVIRCFEYLFKKYSDISLFTPEIQKEVFGPPLKEEMAKLFPEQNADDLVEEYRKYQNSFSWSDEVSLFPNVKTTLETLWQKGYTLGIVSSRMTNSCESWLKQLGLDQYFKVVLGRDLYGKPKPKPDGILYAGVRTKKGHDSCIYIGDNASDVEAAKAAGVYAIAYLSDLKKKEELIAAHPNKIITDMAELLEIVNESHEWSYEKN